MANLDKDAHEELLHSARILVRGGYDTIEGIEEILFDHAQDIAESLSQRDLQLAVRETLVLAVTELTREQAQWPTLTDYDRLKAAFETLEDEGIVARENFTCCGNCGVAEIGEEIEDYQSQTGRAAVGYVFFHQQDTENAVEGYGLHFNYGSAEEDWTEEKSLAVGQRLYNVLQAVGLTPDWDGSISRRVSVKIDWKRRWEGDMPKPAKRWFF